MNIVKSLVEYLKSDRRSEKQQTPEGLCPNCWGRQEYGGNFYDAVQNHGLDVNTKDPQVGWVKEYAEKHLKGIMLRGDDETAACQACKINYKLK